MTTLEILRYTPHAFMSTADLWFYASVTAFAASLLLWPYLFVRYRRALPEANKPPSPILPPKPRTAAPELPGIVPVVAPPRAETPRPLASVPVAQAAPPAKEPPPKESLAADAGNPGLAYLRGVKSQLEQLDKDVQDVRERILRAPAPPEAKPDPAVRLQLEQLDKDVKDVKEQILRAPKPQEIKPDPAVQSQLERLGKDVQEVRDQVLKAVQAQEAKFDSLAKQLTDLKEGLSKKPAARKAPAAKAQPPAPAAPAKTPPPVPAPADSKPVKFSALRSSPFAAPKPAPEGRNPPDAKKKGSGWPG